MKNKYNYHVDGSTDSSMIFVFGSNEAGVHGAGAAAAAHRFYGAKWGIGEGHTGNTYALPTKDTNIQTLPLTAVKDAVDRFLDYARLHSDQKFFVTRVGCGLAGYNDFDIAPMFVGAPTNCNFPEDWQIFLEVS